MKVLLLIISTFLLPLGYSSRGNGFFIDKVQETYSSYVVEVEEVNQRYDLCIVSGIANNEKAFGVFFDANDINFILVFQIGEEIYEFKKDDDGSVWALASKYTEEVRVLVYDKGSKTSEVKLVINDEIFLKKQLLGLNRGCEFESLSSLNDRFLNQIILYVGCGVVVTVCIVLLLVFKVTHSGLFSKAKRRATTFSMKEFIQDAPEETDPYDPINDMEIIEYSEEVKPKTLKSPKEYLIEKGFITDYKILSEEEKNSIMLELMHLKNSGVITAEQYKKETIELWKK